MKAQQITNIRGAASLQKKLTNKRSDILFLFSFLDCVCFLFVLLFFAYYNLFHRGVKIFQPSAWKLLSKKTPQPNSAAVPEKQLFFFFSELINITQRFRNQIYRNSHREFSERHF